MVVTHVRFNLLEPGLSLIETISAHTKSVSAGLSVNHQRQPQQQKKKTLASWCSCFTCTPMWSCMPFDSH